MRKRVLFAFSLLLLGTSSLFSQGIYKEFGQNRIQFQHFEWKQLSLENIDLLYNDNEELLAGKALDIASVELKKLENHLSYKYGGAMQIVVFNSLNEYRQSNIGYTNPQLSTGGYLVIPNDVSAVYFNGDYSNLKIQLRQAICEVMLREMIYGGTLQDRFERVRSPILPAWFTTGLTHFLAQSWNADLENQMIDAFANHGFANFNSLSESESILAGHSIWRYLVENYGAESVSTIMFISRYTHSAEAAIYFHTHKTIAEFIKEWRDYYSLTLAPAATQNSPVGTSNIPKKISQRKHTDFSLSPDGKTVALVTNDQGRYAIWTFDLVSGKIKHLYSGGQKVLNQLPDYDFPRLKWHPNLNTLNFITYDHGEYRLMEVKNNKPQELTVFSNVKNVIDFAFKPNSDTLVFIGVLHGHSDLFFYNMRTAQITQITNDFYAEKNLVFTADGAILFASNRPALLVQNEDFTSEVQNIFKWKNGNIVSITGYNSPITITSIIDYSDSVTGYLSDLSGLSNAYAINNNTHIAKGQTNYQNGILSQCISNDRTVLGELLLIRGSYHIFTSQVPADPLEESVWVTPLKWKKSLSNLDSLFADRNNGNTLNYIEGADSAVTSIVDSTSRNYVYQTGFPKIDFRVNSFPDSLSSYNTFKRVEFHNSLQPDFFLSQSENRVLGSYYQSNLIRRDALRNSVIMPYFKVSLSDYLKNYIFEAGVRSSLDLLVTDYTSRFGAYKNRVDHDVMLSRHSRKYEDGFSILKQHISTQFQYSLSFPFSEKSRLSASLGARQEFNTIKASEAQVLNVPDINQRFATSRLEYVYDNTASLGLNMTSGLRMSAGIDIMKQLKSNQTVANLVADIRYYLPIYRKVIWASRFTGAYSTGNAKVAYYLGAVENWTSKTQFVANTPSMTGDNMPFQQWVSNLRGFYRGIRMGNNFLLFNTELRVPIFQTFITKPMESEFFRNFTVTGFTDIGTAFTGKSPSDPSNPFNTNYLTTPNYDISITSARNPYAIGLGAGIRTRFLGYFIKYDYAWGYLENKWQAPVNYLSIGFDF